MGSLYAPRVVVKEGDKGLSMPEITPYEIIGPSGSFSLTRNGTAALERDQTIRDIRQGRRPPPLPSSWHCTARELDGFPGDAGRRGGRSGRRAATASSTPRTPSPISISMTTHYHQDHACGLPTSSFFFPTTRDNPDFINENEITEYMVKHQSMDLFGGAKIKC